MTWIAEMAVVFVDAHGKRTPGRIAIGLPEPEEGDRDVRCAVALDGIYPGIGPVIGADAMQALVLALSLIGTLLHDWLAHGGRVLSEDGSDARVDATFGPLLRSVTG